MHTLHAVAQDKDGGLLAEVIKPVEIPAKPDWYDSKVGTAERVLPPWTPLSVEEDDAAEDILPAAKTNVSCWGRKYTLGMEPLPEQMMSAGEQLLSAPMRLVGRVNNRNIQWRLNGGVVESESETATTINRKAADSLLTLDTKMTIEFDGLMRLDFSVVPKSSVHIEKLSFEIPLRREQASLVYYYRDRLMKAPGTIPDTGVVRSWNPCIWLGNEDRGLQWFTESDRHWYLGDPNQAVEIVPRGDTVIFRLNLVSKPITLKPGITHTGDAAPDLKYTFGLQATPTKPVEKDAWDYRTATSPWYGKEYALLDTKIEGQNGLDFFAQKGVRTLILVTSWTEWFAYPKCVGYEKELRKMVRECHKRGISLLVYMGSLLAEQAPEVPAFVQDFGTWHAARPYSVTHFTNGPPPARFSEVYVRCIGSDWPDLMAHKSAELLREYDLDGFYFDGAIIPAPCYNTHHGCGYARTDGTAAPTYPIWRAVKAARRMYAVVMDHKATGLIDHHPGSFRCSAIQSYTTNIWDGETILGSTRRPKDRVGMHLTDYLSLDLFRAQLMGKQWGNSSEFLEYYIPVPFKRQFAVTALHDVPIRPHLNIEGVKYISKIWAAFDAFGRKEAEWLPYWKNRQYVTAEASNSYVSLYRHPENGVMAVVSNLDKAKQVVTARFDLNRLGLSENVSATNAMTGEAVLFAGQRAFLGVGFH